MFCLLRKCNLKLFMIPFPVQCLHQQLFCFFYIDCFSFFFRCNLKFSVHTRNRCIRCMRCKRDRLFFQNFLCLIRIKRQLHIYLCFFFFQSAKFAVSAKKCSFFSIRNCFLDCLIFFFILKPKIFQRCFCLFLPGFQYNCLLLIFSEMFFHRTLCFFLCHSGHIYHINIYVIANLLLRIF